MIARRSFLRTSILSASLLSVPPAMANAASSDAVSPTLAALIAAYERHTAELAGVEEGSRAWDKASDARLRALDSLLDYKPANIAELAAKADALKPFMTEDVDLVSLDVVLDDIKTLAGGSK
jgi:hypothetical protein